MLAYNGMSDSETDFTVARSRALMTERERELIAADEYDTRNYQAISRVRNRINNELPSDVAILKENHQELLGELQAVVQNG